MAPPHEVDVAAAVVVSAEVVEVCTPVFSKLQQSTWMGKVGVNRLMTTRSLVRGQLERRLIADRVFFLKVDLATAVVAVVLLAAVVVVALLVEAVVPPAVVAAVPVVVLMVAPGVVLRLSL